MNHGCGWHRNSYYSFKFLVFVCLFVFLPRCVVVVVVVGDDVSVYSAIIPRWFHFTEAMLMKNDFLVQSVQH